MYLTVLEEKLNKSIKPKTKAFFFTNNYTFVIIKIGVEYGL